MRIHSVTLGKFGPFLEQSFDFRQAERGLPLAGSARPFAMLAGLAALYALLAFLRLRAMAASTMRAAPLPDAAAADAAPRGIGGAFTAEWRRVLGNRGAFIMLVLAPRGQDALRTSWARAGPSGSLAKSTKNRSLSRNPPLSESQST